MSNNIEDGAMRLLERIDSGGSVCSIYVADIDQLLRTGTTGEPLLSRLVEFELLAYPQAHDPLLLTKLVDSLVRYAERASINRLRNCRPRSLWGVSPIIQLANCCEADRRLGFEAETIVYTTYYITSRFDINLQSQCDWVLAECPEKLASYQWMVFFWALLSYDVFHFFNDRGLLANVGGYGSERFGISLQEMRLLRRAGKRLYTYAYGADYRMRQATLAMGKYNFCMACPEIGKFCLCDDVGGREMLATIGSYSNAMIATGLAMTQIPNARNLFYLIFDPNDLKFKLSPGVSVTNRVFRVAHVPNHTFFKGTHLLERAVSNLHGQGVSIELVSLSGVPNSEILRLMTTCDVVADQFIGGSFGYTAIEAMALSKPVLCYLSPDVDFPNRDTLPIIQAHPEHLEDVLLDILKNRDSLPEVGRRSREYVEKHYSVDAFSSRLRTLYLETAFFPLAMRKWIEKGQPLPVWQRHFFNVITFFNRHWRECRAFKPFFTRHWRKCRAFKNYLGEKYGILLALIRRGIREAFTKPSELLLYGAMRLGPYFSRYRMRAGQLRSLWGVTPILTLPLLARCDRLLGIRSDSFVFTSYHITNNFDINLKGQLAMLIKYVPAAHQAFLNLVLAWALLRYDIFHFFYDRGILSPTDFRIGINPRELDILTRAGKHLFCYAYGADVRVRDTTLRLGTYNLCVSCPSPMTYCMCDDAVGQENVDNIRRHANSMLAMGDMVAYVPGCRNQHYWPLDTTRLPYVGVHRAKNRPLRIAHVPNHTHFKGSSYLEDVVAALIADGYSIEMMRAHGVPNERVIEIYSEADLVADQFIAGFHGYAALEAMALGKPVLCYLRGPDMMLDPDTCPIINASPENLYKVLKHILNEDIDLVDVGLRGRAYIEKYYSLEAVARRQGEMYMELLPLSRGSTERIQQGIQRCYEL